MKLLTLLLGGFSAVSALILAFAYLAFYGHMRKTLASRLAGTVLLGVLCALQLAHVHHLLHGTALFESRAYVMLLVAAPPAFYFFSREILLPDRRFTPVQILHVGAPLAYGLLLPLAIVPPVAFAVGSGYTLWFARIVYGMRRHVHRFRFEMFFFGFFAVVALAVLVLGLMLPRLDPVTFYYTYANLTGLAFVLIVAALLAFPEITNDIAEAATLSYSTSTLRGVDVDACLERLDRLMQEDRLFQNESLNLRMLAEAMALSPHQLSELINTRFGMSFPRYVREQRVAEAQRLLREDRTSSVLAISLATGFRSQSNFYAAFREITGETPGAWRRRHVSPDGSMAQHRRRR